VVRRKNGGESGGSSRKGVSPEKKGGAAGGKYHFSLGRPSKGRGVVRWGGTERRGELGVNPDFVGKEGVG